MEARISGGIEQHFGEIEDPRVDRTKLHKLVDILVIAICAVIAGAESWEDVAEFGLARAEWFKTILELPNGLGGQVIAIDGKVLRRSQDKGIGKAAIDMVSAWATANDLVLGQIKVDEKSNEITAIPRLLDALEVAGCIVTIDAMGCQTEIAEKIIEREANYVLALKENQGNLYEDVVLLFDDLENSQYKAYIFDYDKTVNKDHGRIETRECWTISDPVILEHLRGFVNWKNLVTVSRIRAERQIGEERSCEDRYHIASFTGATRVMTAVRSHWGIENRLHWVLDIAFDEDHCRVRKDHGPENFAVLRKSAHKFRHGHAVYGLQHAQTMADYKAVSMNLMHEDIKITDEIYAPILSREVQLRISRLGGQPTIPSDNKFESLARNLSNDDLSTVTRIVAERLSS